jgi:hypothetical protein
MTAATDVADELLDAINEHDPLPRSKACSGRPAAMARLVASIASPLATLSSGCHRVAAAAWTMPAI